MFGESEYTEAETTYFKMEIKNALFKWLNHRSQRWSFDLDKFKMYIKHNPLPKPKIYVNVYR